MFKIKQNPTFRVAVPMPVPGVAEKERPKVEVEFRHKTKAELAAYVKACAERSDVDNLAEIIVGWSGVGDGEGQGLAYSRDALEQLLDQLPAAAGALAGAYFGELAAARLGN